MKIFDQITSKIYYYFDTYKANYSKTKVEKFQFDHITSEIIVIYRVGNKRLLNKLPILKFEHNYFDKCSNFDQHRLTKFSTLKKLLEKTSLKNDNYRSSIIDFIDYEAKHEQLF